MMLKKLTIYIVMAVLCPFLGFAQGDGVVGVPGKGIQIGQKVPDVVISGIYNYKNVNGKQVNAVKLSDFKGKLLILDFWATWCAPCVAMMPRLDSLQRMFAEKVSIVSVSDQAPKVVLPFVEKQELGRGKGRFSMPMVVGDQVLGRLFPHTILPHYVWIDANGVVLGSTGLEELRADRIESVLKGGVFNSKQKVDALKRSHDTERLLVEQGLVLDTPSGFFYSSMGRFVEGLLPRIESFATNGKFGRRVLATNYVPLKLMQESFSDLGNFDMRNTVLEVVDQSIIRPLKGADVGLWRKEHGVCYERTVPSNRNLYAFMRKDIADFFPAYKIAVSTRTMKCLALVEIDDTRSYRAIGSGVPIREISEEEGVFKYLGFKSFISPLFSFYLQGIPMPIVDGTGYKGLIDIRIDGSMKNLENINRSLLRYGLKFEERMMPTEVLVVSDVANVGKGASDE